MTFVPVPGSERHPLQTATVQGRADTEELLQVTIVPKSDDRATREAMQHFAREQGLALNHEHGLFKLTGSVASMEEAFNVTLYTAVTNDDETFRSRVGSNQGPQPVHVPDSLAPHVIAVLGLDNRKQADPHFRIHYVEENGLFRPSDAAPEQTAQQVAQMYSFPQGDGSGQSVAIIELGGGFLASDVQAAGINQANVIGVGVDGARNSPSGDANSADGEVMLDIDVIGGVAPGCKQYVYFAPNTDAGFVDAVAAALHGNPRPVAISISWGAPESSWTAQARTAMDTIFQQCVAAGVPVFSAAGDNGANDGTGGPVTDFPASAPHQIGCGGTSLPSIAQESVWNDSGGGATGGGISQAFPKPPYQSALSINGRGVPDVAGDAAPGTGYRVIVGGKAYQFGGTSAVAPLWTGLSALLVAALGQPLGDLASRLYPLLGTPAFHDITVGGNNGYNAGPGWDACTGLGSPNGQALLAALQGSTPQPPTPTPTPTPTPPTPPKPTPPSVYPVGVTNVQTIKMNDGSKVTRSSTWP